MAGRKILPDVPTLMRHIDRGLTHQQIADMYGTSRQAVTLKLKGAVEPRRMIREWPWDVQSRHKTGWLYEAISYYMVARNKEFPLSERQRHRLTSLMSTMEKLPGDFVVDYYPETAHGFKFRRRQPDDEQGTLLGVSRHRTSVSSQD